MEIQNTSDEDNTDQDYIHIVLRHGLTSFRDAFITTCRSADQPYNQCGRCKACLVSARIQEAKDWWLQAGDLMKRRFLLALINHLKPDIIDHLAQILRPFVNAKDYTYTRNKVDRAPRPTTGNIKKMDDIDPIKRQEEAAKLILWFNYEDKYSQGSFILSILQWCDSQLMFTVAVNVFSVQNMDSDDEDFRTETNNNNRSRLSSVFISAPSMLTSVPHSAPILKRPKTTGSPSMHRKSAVSFALSVLNNNDSDTERPMSTKRIPQYKDFIRQLPVYVAKSILNMLDIQSLEKCKLVSPYWKKMVLEVNDDATMTKLRYDDVMLLQSSAALQCNPCFARDTLVPVPDLYRTNTNEHLSTRKKLPNDKNISAWNKLYQSTKTPTRLVLMEERNIYCGPYNVLLLKDDSERHRPAHMSGESLVAIASRDSRVRFIDMQSAQDKPMILVGHAASVHCIVVQEDKKRIFTGSYDLTVRCWSLETGRCMKLYHGHERTVTCLAVFLDLIAAGGNDNLCLVWRYKRHRPWRTFKHKHPVSAVAINDDFTVSGDIQGKIKVWHNLTGKFIKCVKHRLAITGVKFDKWHIASSSRDYYANVWSTQGTFDKPLTALRHPKEVLCLEFLYLRVITGCADGKIRIWNALSGTCLRVMRGNSVSDPVTGLVVTLNRLLVNTKSSLLLMNFEPVNYDYTLEEDKPPITETSTSSILSASMNKRKHISVRQRQTSASSKLSTVSTQESIDEKKKGVTIASNKENNGGGLTLEETKELLKKQIRGDPEQKQSLIPAEFRKSQQAALYQTNKSQDDTIYSEHRPVPLKMTDRPPSSPSRFDLRRRMASSQSQFYTRPPSASDLTSTNTSISRFEIIHRPPSQNRIHISQTNTDVSSIFKSSSLDEEKVQLLQPQQQKPDKPRLIRPRTSTTIPTYEVKRGSKIYKVVVGYVSPYTSPLQRKELNLKTDGEIDLIFKQIKKQQEIQRASQQQIWLGLSPQPTS
ncbi:unnamed protein product [Adineta steineri]|uniref:F-box domain-containing protein n=1 Tax=Adineta steineri TaxID=433720 RepID=A0A813XJV8_9BILA|nr:unnamed protein product [Adineta steineri]CAF0869218.1 unnamed protein product [Adineta steineri]CAF1014641.1 unnamed protein product [Adineta steineri]